jgi:hypothetical protein
MVQYCNENNIEFLVPKELIENFNYVIDNREEEIMLFEAYPCLFKYLRDNLNKLEPNKCEDNILDYITEMGAFSEKYVPDFISSNDLRISEVKLINQIFFPNRYISSSLHMLFSKKEFPLLQKIKNYIESKIKADIHYRNYLITLTEKQFEYIFKYHFEFDSISVNIFSDIRYLFSEREQNELTDDQEETIEFFEDFLSDINTNVNKKTFEWKSTKSQF